MDGLATRMTASKAKEKEKHGLYFYGMHEHHRLNWTSLHCGKGGVELCFCTPDRSKRFLVSIISIDLKIRASFLLVAVALPYESLASPPFRMRLTMSNSLKYSMASMPSNGWLVPIITHLTDIIGPCLIPMRNPRSPLSVSNSTSSRHTVAPLSTSLLVSAHLLPPSHLHHA